MERRFAVGGDGVDDDAQAEQSLRQFRVAVLTRQMQGGLHKNSKSINYYYYFMFYQSFAIVCERIHFGVQKRFGDFFELIIECNEQGAVSLPVHGVKIDVDGLEKDVNCATLIVTGRHHERRSTLVVGKISVGAALEKSASRIVTKRIRS